SVALLFEPSSFADAVRHQAHETLGQHRHFLNQFRKKRSRKSQGAAGCFSSPAYGKSLHPGKRQDTGHVPRLEIKDESFAGSFGSSLKLPLKNDKHRIRRIALPDINVARLEIHLLRLADEPVELIIRQIGEDGHAA